MSLAKYAEDNERLNNERQYFKEYREAQQENTTSATDTASNHHDTETKDLKTLLRRLGINPL